MNPSLSPTAGALFAFLSSVTWAAGISVYSKLNREHAASTINFSRALVALPCFILAASLGLFSTGMGITPWRASLETLELSNYAWLATSIFASYAFGDLLLLKSVRVLGLPSALAIASSYPIWSAIAAWWLRDEALGFQKMFGLILVVLGTVTVILYGANEAEKKRAHTLDLSNAFALKDYLAAVAIAICTSLCWTLNTVAVAKGGASVSPTVANTLRMGFALILCPVFGFYFNQTSKMLLPKKDFLKAIPIFIFEGFAGSLFFMLGLSAAPLAVAAALSSLAPVITVPLAWAFGLEKPSFVRTFGVILVVIGIWNLVGIFSGP